jgi:hypothetical protein
VRHGIRGGAGLVAMLLTLLIGVFAANVVISPLEAFDRMGEELSKRGGFDAAEQARYTEEMKAQTLKATRKAIDWAVSESEEQTTFLTSSRPSVISAILVIIFLFTPLLTCLGGFNQTSGDIGSKGLRFLLIRTERPNIFLGRFIGTYLFSGVIYGVLFLVIALYAGLKVHVHGTGEMMLWLAEGYLRLMLLALPYTALCALISAAVDSPFGSLCLTLLVSYMYPMLVMMAGNINKGAAFLQYGTPWGFKWWLLMPFGGHFFGAVAAMLGFTGVFLFLGLRNFSGRDL